MMILVVKNYCLSTSLETLYLSSDAAHFFAELNEKKVISNFTPSLP